MYPYRRVSSTLVPPPTILCRTYVVAIPKARVAPDLFHTPPSFFSFLVSDSGAAETSNHTRYLMRFEFQHTHTHT